MQALKSAENRHDNEKNKGRSACARIAGPEDDYLFADVDKEKGMKVFQDLA